MNLLVALGVGYVLGAKTGRKDLDKLGSSVKALLETDELAEVVSAARAHVASLLRDVASMVDGGTPSHGGEVLPDGGDLVTRVKRLVGQG